MLLLILLKPDTANKLGKSSSTLHPLDWNSSPYVQSNIWNFPGPNCLRVGMHEHNVLYGYSLPPMTSQLTMNMLSGDTGVSDQ